MLISTSNFFLVCVQLSRRITLKGSKLSPKSHITIYIGVICYRLQTNLGKETLLWTYWASLAPSGIKHSEKRFTINKWWRGPSILNIPGVGAQMCPNLAFQVALEKNVTGTWQEHPRAFLVVQRFPAHFIMDAPKLCSLVPWNLLNLQTWYLQLEFCYMHFLTKSVYKRCPWSIWHQNVDIFEPLLKKQVMIHIDL